jgi:hypothetical protein
MSYDFRQDTAPTTRTFFRSQRHRGPLHNSEAARTFVGGLHRGPLRPRRRRDAKGCRREARQLAAGGETCRKIARVVVFTFRDVHIMRELRDRIVRSGPVHGSGKEVVL